MELNHSQHFSILSGEFCILLYTKNYDKSASNKVIDELNAKPYNTEFFVRKNSEGLKGNVFRFVSKSNSTTAPSINEQFRPWREIDSDLSCLLKHTDDVKDGISLIEALCLNLSPTDEFLAVKASHLMTSILTKQNLQLSHDFLHKVINWHLGCLKQCSDIVLPDIVYNLQCLLCYNPQSGSKFTDELIGSNGLLLKFITWERTVLNNQDPLSMSLMTLKCICSLTAVPDESKMDQSNVLNTEIKGALSKMIVEYLLRVVSKPQDDFIYCKVVIYSLKILAQLYFGQQDLNIPLPDVMGICRYYVLYGLIPQGARPDRILAAQQIIAAPNNYNHKGGKKQKLRKQKNKAIESLKKDIPVSDRSLMKDVDNFQNNSAYRPFNQNYFDPQKSKNSAPWTLMSDSDVSDVESNREAKLAALKSRVRQSASNLLLVLIKVIEKKDMFGYWWALLPDCPNPSNWAMEDTCKSTLAYCAVCDPIATSRTAALSVILALLSGSRMYLSQAESSKKETASFIPFSVSLGYTITCMHVVLTGILENERVLTVTLVALKCCAALVQATPYHKLKEGLISGIVRSTRKFLVHTDVTLQVGALITIGCVLSIDPKVEEQLKAIEKDSATLKKMTNESKVEHTNELNDFEEGYSDDEMFIEVESADDDQNKEEKHHFKSWILDICFKNMGAFKGQEILKCKPAAIPIVLESLQVISAVAFHHFDALLKQHMDLLAEVLSEILKSDHQELVAQAARIISIVGDAIQKLEAVNISPPILKCVYFWMKTLSPLASVLQSRDNAPAKAVACDCIGNIGERSFKELPRRMQMICCALLMGSCSDEEAIVRAAAVRALAMAVMYRVLREDTCFVSDCGENILRALTEPTIVVRTKACWALGNLSDALVLNMEDPQIDEIDDVLFLRLFEVSIQCAVDNDKVKMNATRALGNLLILIKYESILRNPQIKVLCETAIDKLMDCACKVTSMKVRWNACHAIGKAMKNDCLFTHFNGWQRKVFTNLCTLTQECKNLKVRINAAVALRAPGGRTLYAEHLAPIWRSVMAAIENAANVHDYAEYKHKDNLIEQLCVTLSHLCCLLTTSDLTDILDPLSFHYECCKDLMAHLCHRLPPENASCLAILEAAKYVTLDLTASTDSQQHSLGMLQEIFIWEL